MTPKLPVVSGRQCVKILEQIGYVKVRQRGSHIRLKDRSGNLPSITVPDHKELRPGLLKKILKDANLSVEELNRQLNK